MQKRIVSKRKVVRNGRKLIRWEFSYYPWHQCAGIKKVKDK